MSEFRVRLRPTAFGIGLMAAVGLILIPGGLAGTAPPVLILGAGLALLVMVSLLFLLGSLPFIRRTYLKSGAGADVLPPVMECGTAALVEADPARPGFLPGVRLAACWKLRFGPFHRKVSIPLPPGKGPARGEVAIPRRGDWKAATVLEAADPFGLFTLELVHPEGRQVVVPPRRRELAGTGTAGRPTHETASAPRPKEDAEELMERRDYRPGDDIRKIDWKQMARTGDLLVRIGDDVVPLQGRVWIDVPCSGGRFGRWFPRVSVKRLDPLLEAADALVRRLTESGQEAVVRLPGEEGWKPASGDDWFRRLAGALPGPSGGGDPPAGERLWVIAGTGDTAAMETVRRAGAAGGSVTLGYPDIVKIAPWTTVRGLLFRGDGETAGILQSRLDKYRLDRAVTRAGGEGADVRRI